VTALPLCATLTLPGQPRYVARAREFVSIALGRDHPCADSLTVIVSELVTNSMVHSRSGNDGGTVTITLRPSPGDGLGRRPHGVRVEVTDDGADGLPALRPVGACDPGGRGLHLVDALAAAWNCSRDPAGTTTTWAEVIA
jgi:anti-sigma regulatory factor (Ser/Thr protein kinase)